MLSTLFFVLVGIFLACVFFAWLSSAVSWGVDRGNPLAAVLGPLGVIALIIGAVYELFH